MIYHIRREGDSWTMLCGLPCRDAWNWCYLEDWHKVNKVNPIPWCADCYKWTNLQILAQASL